MLFTIKLRGYQSLYVACDRNNKHLLTGPEGNSEFCFPREGNKIHCSSRDQSLSDLLYSKANGSNRWKTNNHVIDK